MEWFAGSIPEAIISSKIRNAVFLVFIDDSSEAAGTTQVTLSSVAAVLSKNTVAVRLDSTSEESKQFSQIYPVVVLPSVYFINPVTGVPVEILAGAVTPGTLHEKLPGIISCGKGAGPPPVSSESSSSSVTSAVAPSVPLEEPASTSDDDRHSEVEADPEQSACTASDENGGAGVSACNSPDAPSSNSILQMTVVDAEPDVKEESAVDDDGLPQVTLVERVARAKAMAEERQALREEEVRQKEITNETSRRHTGKEMLRVKREQEERERRDLAAERRREKEEDRLAKERVRALIAADSAEREQRDALRRGVVPPAPAVPARAPTPATSDASPAVCRIKLRLPDGSSVLAQFPPTALLSAVYSHVRQHVSLPFRSFRLASSVHQRPFTEDDSENTLEQLGLAPSAIVVVMPARAVSGSSGGAGVVTAGDGAAGLLNALLWLLMLPYNTLTGLLRLLTGGGGAGAEANASPTTDDRTPDEVRRRPDRPKTAYGRRDARYRRDGNIHRLGTDGDDDDDENNTWNGNSTQQM